MALHSSMLAICLAMHSEVGQPAFLIDAIKLSQPFDLRLGYSWDLTLIGVVPRYAQNRT